jgi:hypothetical protein
MTVSTAKTGTSAADATGDAGSAAWPNYWSVPMLVVSIASMTSRPPVRR